MVAALIVLVAYGVPTAPADEPALLWSQAYSGQGLADGRGLLRTAVGYTWRGRLGRPAETKDAFLLHYDDTGTLLWSRTWGGSHATGTNA